MTKHDEKLFETKEELKYRILPQDAKDILERVRVALKYLLGNHSLFEKSFSSDSEFMVFSRITENTITKTPYAGFKELLEGSPDDVILIAELYKTLRDVLSKYGLDLSKFSFLLKRMKEELSLQDAIGKILLTYPHGHKAMAVMGDTEAMEVFKRNPEILEMLLKHAALQKEVIGQNNSWAFISFNPEFVDGLGIFSKEEKEKLLSIRFRWRSGLSFWKEIYKNTPLVLTT